MSSALHSSLTWTWNWNLIRVFRRKHFVQKQELFIDDTISAEVKDEEKAELFKRSNVTTKKYL